jgi:serine/threonine-protein kinase HipA
MALKLNGKDDRLTRQDFLTLARTIGLGVGDAEAAMDELTERLAEGVKTLNLPAFAAKAEAARAMQAKVVALVEDRCAAFSGNAE